MQVDCNECEYLSITEAEQNYFHDIFKENIPHMCAKFNKRVFHNQYPIRFIGVRNHNSYLYPCEECLKEKENETA